MNDNLFKKIVDARIQWQQLSGPYFQSNFQGKIIKLRLNDFPDEVLWTLIVDGEELNLEETPPHWILPPE